MSDLLSRRLQEPAKWKPKKSDDPDQRVIDAMEKALEATTPEHPGCPWDIKDKEDTVESGIWVSESD